MNPAVIDAIIFLVLLVFLMVGYHRGFVMTLCGLLAMFVALIGAALVTHQLLVPVSQAILPSFESAIQSYLEDNVPQLTAQTDLQAVWDSLSQSHFFRHFLDSLSPAFQEQVGVLTADLVHSLALMAALFVAKAVLFPISFLLIYVIWVLLSKTLNLACKLPVLHTFNNWGGAAIGLLKAAILVFIAVWLLRGNYFPQELIDQTHLLKFFCNINPLELALRFIH